MLLEGNYADQTPWDVTTRTGKPNPNLFCLPLAETPTAERNNLGKPEEVLSFTPWWDKIGVNTSMKFKTKHNWRHPAMTDEEIEELVSQMPSEQELAGLSASERDAYLRSRYNTIQTTIAKTRSERRRNANTFEPVIYEADWQAEPGHKDVRYRPSDAPKRDIKEEDYDGPEPYRFKEGEVEYEDLPPVQPYGPRAPPPPLPEPSFWNARKRLTLYSKLDEWMQRLQQNQERKVAEMEARLDKSAPWLSHDETVRTAGERRLRLDPDSRTTVDDSLRSATLLQQTKANLQMTAEVRHFLTLKAQGGHERLAWHQIAAQEWQDMSDVEFAFWRNRIVEDFVHSRDGRILLEPGSTAFEGSRGTIEADKTLLRGESREKSIASVDYLNILQRNQEKIEARLSPSPSSPFSPSSYTPLEMDLNHAGTFNFCLRRALEEWQDALYRYEEAKRPAHLTADDLSIWHYELTKSEWYKAGVALETRLQEVERRAVLHRRRVVLEFLAQSYGDWAAYYNVALENARTLENWGAEWIAQQSAIKIPSAYGKQSLATKNLLFHWHEIMTSIMQGLQHQKEIGPLPFQVPVEKLDQHVIDKIYAHLMAEEEKAALQGSAVAPNQLPPMPLQLKMILTNPLPMLASSGDDAASGLFGPKLLEKRRTSKKEFVLRTVAEMDRRRNLMIKYWQDHGIKSISVDDQEYSVEGEAANKIAFEAVERCYFDLLDQDVDVHGLYEQPQWQVDEANRYRASTLAPVAVVPERVSRETLAAAEERAFALFDDLTALAFPPSADDTSQFLSDSAHRYSSPSLQLRPRDLTQLTELAKSGAPAIVRAEREAAFFSVEFDSTDPQPHLWSSLLTQVWKTRKPPGWLVSRCRKDYEEWWGLTEQDMLTNQLDEATLPAATAQSTSTAPVDLRNSLNNPRRQAWEMAKRVKEYKSMLLGAHLTDQQQRDLKRAKTFSTQLQALSSNSTAESAPENSSEVMDTTTLKAAELKNNFETLRRDLIRSEDLVAADWLLNFDFKPVLKQLDMAGASLFVKVKDLEGFKSRLQDDFLMHVKRFTPPSPAIVAFHKMLDSTLQRVALPQEVLDLEIDLYHRRQKIEKAHAEGLPDQATALLMHYYSATELKKKVDLLQRANMSNPERQQWYNDFFGLNSDSKAPRTLAAMVYKTLKLPFNMLRSMREDRLGIEDATQSRKWAGPQEEERRAARLVGLAKHLERMNAAQPWRMWSKDSWHSLENVYTAPKQNKDYLETMNGPRRSFWDAQRKLWDEYLDTQLALLHELVLEQRAREGIPVRAGDAPVDGTAAQEQYLVGEAHLAKARVLEALEAFSVAARLGSTAAMYAIGRLYSAEVYGSIEQALPQERRLTQPTLELESRAWLEKAARLGHEDATLLLARTCLQPPSPPLLNLHLAHEMLTLGVEVHNNPLACFMLAKLLESSGAPADLSRALSLYSRVNNPAAQNKVKELHARIASSSPADATHLHADAL